VNAYVDSSVFLSIVFSQKPRFAEFERIETTVSSVLLFIEGRRAVDRARLVPSTTGKMIGSPRDRFWTAVERIEFLEFDGNIVSIASRPFPYVIKTLDAIHLATALEWQRRERKELVFLTHDGRLAAAARRAGFSVLGE
jgi:predicted nucleic acid-binding protein